MKTYTNTYKAVKFERFDDFFDRPTFTRSKCKKATLAS